MAHKRKDTLTSSPDWWRHLRPFNKRKVSKAERRAAKDEIDGEVNESEAQASLGLHNDPKKMQWMRETEGENMIPYGDYCYDSVGFCPYWDKASSKHDQVSGYCWFLRKGDWEDDGTFLLFDQCKECGRKSEIPPEGSIPVREEKMNDISYSGDELVM